MEKEQVRRIDSDPLVKDVGRSGVVRLAVSEFYEKRESGKENQNEESREKK